MTEPVACPQGGSAVEAPDGSVSLLWLIAVLVRDRRVIGLFAALGLALGVVLALMRPTTYTATFSFVPQTSQNDRSGLASLAGQFGLSLGNLTGESRPPQLYADLLSTRGVLVPIATDSFAAGPGSVAKIPLARFLEVRAKDSALAEEATLRVLRNQIVSAIVSSKTGVINVRVKTKSPQVSLAIAQRLLEGLNHFNTVTRQSQAHEERRFTEERLANARDSLRAAEDALLRFSQTNRDISNSNTLTLQQQRLQREVQFQQQVVTSLAQQYEELRIREVRDTPVITVLESPVQPAQPDSRLRILILFLSVAGAACAGIVVVTARDVWRRQAASDDDAALAVLREEWRTIQGGRRS